MLIDCNDAHNHQFEHEETLHVISPWASGSSSMLSARRLGQGAGSHQLNPRVDTLAPSPHPSLAPSLSYPLCTCAVSNNWPHSTQRSHVRCPHRSGSEEHGRHDIRGFLRERDMRVHFELATVIRQCPLPLQNSPAISSAQALHLVFTPPTDLIQMIRLIRLCCHCHTFKPMQRRCPYPPPYQAPTAGKHQSTRHPTGHGTLQDMAPYALPVAPDSLPP